jgi:arsenate reductase
MEEQMTRETIEIIYNPNCSKCRGALSRLRERENIDIHIREYLTEPLHADELRILFKKLAPLSLIRQKDDMFGPWRDQANQLSEDQILEILLEHPPLLQRPIVRRGEEMVVARPPELLDQLFD